MINWLHAKLHRPERGWDPVPAEWADEYSEFEWQNLDENLLDHLDKQLGGLAGKRVLDLGGGPGQYSIAMAQRGAHVTWFDISQRYLNIAQQKAQSLDLHLNWELGYLDDVHRLWPQQFDLIFSRLCWYYSQNDQRLAESALSVLVDGGVLYIQNNNLSIVKQRQTSAKVRAWLNRQYGLKIGHPFPFKGDTAALFAPLPVSKVVADYHNEQFDVVQVWKAKSN